VRGPPGPLGPLGPPGPPGRAVRPAPPGAGRAARCGMAPGVGRGGMLPGVGRGPPGPAAAGRGAPGRAAPVPAPGCGCGPGASGAAPGCGGRGAPGRGATGAELNGLLPTRGALGAGARGPGLCVAAASSAAGAGLRGVVSAGSGRGGCAPGTSTGAGGAADTGSGTTTGVGSSAAGLGPGRGPGRTAASGAAEPLVAAGPLGAGAPAEPFVAAGAAGNAERSRRATGASTVELADLTNSPRSLSFARTSLLLTPSSFASSCTRALPATALLTGRPGGRPARPRTTADERSSLVLHGVLMGCRPVFSSNYWSSELRDLPPPSPRRTRSPHRHRTDRTPLVPAATPDASPRDRHTPRSGAHTHRAHGACVGGREQPSFPAPPLGADRRPRFEPDIPHTCAPVPGPRARYRQTRWCGSRPHARPRQV